MGPRACRTDVASSRRWFPLGYGFCCLSAAPWGPRPPPHSRPRNQAGQSREPLLGRGARGLGRQPGPAARASSLAAAHRASGAGPGQAAHPRSPAVDPAGATAAEHKKHRLGVLVRLAETKGVREELLEGVGGKPSGRRWGDEEPLDLVCQRPMCSDSASLASACLPRPRRARTRTRTMTRDALEGTATAATQARPQALPRPRRASESPRCGDSARQWLPEGGNSFSFAVLPSTLHISDASSPRSHHLSSCSWCDRDSRWHLSDIASSGS